jgi:hypothetical protein
MMDIGKQCGGLHKIRFVQGPQKLNDGTGKMIHVGMIAEAFTAV